MNKFSETPREVILEAEEEEISFFIETLRRLLYLKKN